MIQILLATIITSLICNGLTIVTGEGMIFYGLRKWMDNYFITYTDSGKRIASTQVAIIDVDNVVSIYYPIIYCIKCMPSLYGTIVCLIFFPFTISLLYQIPVVILCSVCLTTILYGWYE